MVKEGIEVEVLTYKMDIEEPTAASTISQALNVAQEVALRTSELTAVSVLKGEMIRQMGKDFSQDVVYKNVLEMVRRELHLAANEPELPDVFDFLRSLGVGKNTYVDQLLQFGAAFVDSKKRQLRFSAFAVVNKVNHDYPLSRVAIVKRAYRKKPHHTFCPNPEQQWTKIDTAFLEKLEQLLFYFHEKRLPAVQKLPEEDQAKFWAAVDVSAAEEFFLKATRTGRWKCSVRTIEETLLESTLKYFEQLETEEQREAEEAAVEIEDARDSFRDDVSVAVAAPAANEAPAAVADNSQARADDALEWIDFNRVRVSIARVADEDSAAGSTNLSISAANIPEFNEQTGARITQETADFPLLRGDTQASREQHYVVPWRQWRRDNTLGSVEADKASAVAVLQGLREGFQVENQPIEMYTLNGKPKIFATQKIREGSLWLPPCVPKHPRMLEESENPNAVEIHVNKMRSADATINSEFGPIERTRTFKLAPDFKLPTLADSAAVAGSINEKRSEDGNWIMERGTLDSMTPFWAVRRLTQAQLDKERSNTKENMWLPRFSCKLAEINLNDVCIYSTVQMENRTRTIVVPFMTNMCDLEEGEELILEVAAKVQKPTTRTWRDAALDEERAQTKNKRKADSMDVARAYEND